jgi:hypothetical protein
MTFSTSGAGTDEQPSASGVRRYPEELSGRHDPLVPKVPTIWGLR